MNKIATGLIVLLGGVGAVAGYVAMQPGAFHYERSTTVTAPPDVVFGLVNDLHSWPQWSPWAALDPNQKTTYAGPATGKGSSSHWSGNDEVGEGTMTIVESKPNTDIHMTVEFIRPFAATNQTTFVFAPAGAADVKVTWSMDGTNSFMAKGAGLFMDMKTMIEADFDKGLAGIKKQAEAEATRRAEEAKKQAAAAQALAAQAAAMAAQAAAAAEAAAAQAPGGAPPAPPIPN